MEAQPYVMRLILGECVAQAVAVAVELGAIDELAAGPRRVGAVAEAVRAHPDALYRLLRLLSGVGLVEERDGRVFALTPPGRTLCRDAGPDAGRDRVGDDAGPEAGDEAGDEDGGEGGDEDGAGDGGAGAMRGMALLMGAPWHRRAWSDLTDCVRTGHSSFERRYGGFAYYRDDPEAGRVFHEAAEETLATHVVPLLRDRDLTRFGTVVDVGGGRGTLLAAVLSGHAEGRGVLFDLPHVVVEARATLERAGVADRCELVGGDFFTAVPSGGDVYLLADIVRDWDDEHAVRILRNCAAAMNDGGRVLLCEAVLPETRNRYSPAAVIDLEMLVMCEGGRQRTAGELGELLGRAGLRLTGMCPGPLYSLLEAVAAPGADTDPYASGGPAGAC